MYIDTLWLKAYFFILYMLRLSKEIFKKTPFPRLIGMILFLIICFENFLNLGLQ